MKALTPCNCTSTNLKKNSTSFSTSVGSGTMITIAFPLLSYDQCFPPCFCLNFTLLERHFDHIPALVQHFDIHIKHYAIHKWECSFKKKNIVHEKFIRNLSSRVNAKKVTAKEPEKKAHLTPYTPGPNPKPHYNILNKQTVIIIIIHTLPPRQTRWIRMEIIRIPYIKQSYLQPIVRDQINQLISLTGNRLLV